MRRYESFDRKLQMRCRSDGKVLSVKVLILGQPGAGTGTQAARVSQILGVPHLSVGTLLRAAIDEHSTIGCAARRYVADGCFVLDGFPRNLAQLDTLSERLRPAGIDLAIELSVRTEVAYERLRSRGRADDDGSVIRRQFEDYTRETEPMIATLMHAGKLLSIDANRTVGDVTAELLRVFHPPRFTNECRHDSACADLDQNRAGGLRHESSPESGPSVQPATTASRGSEHRSEIR
jgi:adenylate kinase